MAPAIGRGAQDHAATHAGPAPAEDQPRPPPVIDQAGNPATDRADQGVSASALPDQVRAALQKLRAEVERNCEHVGDRFADQARSIHRGDSPARAIYGETTPEQAEALADEGIEIARIPWVPRSDA